MILGGLRSAVGQSTHNIEITLEIASRPDPKIDPASIIAIDVYFQYLLPIVAPYPLTFEVVREAQQGTGRTRARRSQMKLVQIVLASIVLLWVHTAYAQQPSDSSRGGNLYLITSLEKYSPYNRARLHLALNGPAITGTLSPLIADPTPPVRVTGSNSVDGVMDLTFHFSGRPRTIKFNKKIQHDKVFWIADGGTEFFRHLNADFSDGALTLFQENCGSQYGAVDVVF